MAEKPQRANEYKSEHVELARATNLYIATRFGDLMDDEVVVIGGLVPLMLVDLKELPEGSDHNGRESKPQGMGLWPRCICYPEGALLSKS